MRDESIQTTKGNAERTAELLREKIRSGELSNDGKIPSIRKLAEAFFDWASDQQVSSIHWTQRPSAPYGTASHNNLSQRILTHF